MSKPATQSEIKRVPPKTDAQILLEMHMGELGLAFKAEYQFHPERRWRFDYLILGRGFAACEAIEIEGGAWQNGRHNRSSGFVKDMEKYREAAALGYRVYRFTPQEVLNGTALEFLKRAIPR